MNKGTGKVGTRDGGRKERGRRVGRSRETKGERGIQEKIKEINRGKEKGGKEEEGKKEERKGGGRNGRSGRKEKKTMGKEGIGKQGIGKEGMINE